MKGSSSSIVLVGILTVGGTSGFFFHKESSPKFEDSAVSLFPPYGGSEERGGFGRVRKFESLLGMQYNLKGERRRND